MPEALPDNIILFDSQCNLCNGWSRFVLHRDKNAIFTLCRVQSPAGQQLLARLGLPLDTYETIIYLERRGDTLVDYHKSEAAQRILAQLPAPWCYLAWLRFVPRAIRDLVYDGIARNRYRLFGKRQECKLPGPEERQRFLEEIDVD
ncbi:thiol-disulfide oxidoreductase DCC family protein [Microbulbifer sp.]|uniref:thiol-disulfide oxidoreductase DCC family protein n=1 Tax=Microbulbifer sp. TaxID=1908541 RepID=UPI003F314E20